MSKKSNVVYFIPALAWAIIILVLSVISGKKLPNLDFWTLTSPDKAGHAFFHFVFTVLLFYGRVKSTQQVKVKTAIVAFCIAGLYGIGIEIIQKTMFSYRNFESLDIVANIIGSLIAMTGIIIWLKIFRK
jgi:VanZ family protein